MPTEHNHSNPDTSGFEGQDLTLAETTDFLPVADPEIIRNEIAQELSSTETERGEENAIDSTTDLAPAFEIPDAQSVVMDTFGGTEADWVSTGPAFASGTYLINGEMTGAPRGIDTTKGADLLSQGKSEVIEQNQEMIQALERDGYFAKDFKNGEGAFVAYLDESRQIIYENFERATAEEEKKPEENEVSPEVQPPVDANESGSLDVEIEDDPAGITENEVPAEPLIQINLTEAVRETVPSYIESVDAVPAQQTSEVPPDALVAIETVIPTAEHEESVVDTEVIAPEVPSEVQAQPVVQEPALEVAPPILNAEPAAEPVSDLDAREPLAEEERTADSVSPVTAEATNSAAVVAARTESIKNIVTAPPTPELDSTIDSQELVATPPVVKEVEDIAPAPVLNTVRVEAPTIVTKDDVVASAPVAPAVPERTSPSLVVPELNQDVVSFVDTIEAPPVNAVQEKTSDDVASAPEASRIQQATETISIESDSQRADAPLENDKLTSSVAEQDTPRAAESVTVPSNEANQSTDERVVVEVDAAIQNTNEVRATGNNNEQTTLTTAPSPELASKASEYVESAVAIEAELPIQQEELDSTESERTTYQPVTAETYAFLEEHGLPRPPLRVVQTAGIEAARARRGLASVVAGGLTARRRSIVSLSDKASGITLKRAA